jgi:hypothetical protein
VRVEEDLHRASGACSDICAAHGYEWKLVFELLDRASILGYRSIDLLWESLVVAKGKSELTLSGRSPFDKTLDRPDV